MSYFCADGRTTSLEWPTSTAPVMPTMDAAATDPLPRRFSGDSASVVTWRHQRPRQGVTATSRYATGFRPVDEPGRTNGLSVDRFRSKQSSPAFTVCVDRRRGTGPWAFLRAVFLGRAVPYMQVVPTLSSVLPDAPWGGSVSEAVPIGVAGILVWAVWAYRVILSARAKPIINGFRTTTSVVVPSYREDADILLRCLQSWLSQDPTEVILVPDVHDVECLARLAEVDDPRVKVIPFAHTGKRSALGVGIRAATSEIVVLADSDTWWKPRLLEYVQ